MKGLPPNGRTIKAGGKSAATDWQRANVGPSGGGQYVGLNDQRASKSGQGRSRKSGCVLGDKPGVGGSSDDRLCPAHREFAMGVGEMTEDEFIGFLKAAMT
jgi:hypothetical protein